MCKLTKEEIEKPRTPKELILWAEKVIDRINSSKDKNYKDSVRMKQENEAKIFLEETVALKRFCEECFKRKEDDIKIIQKIGNQNYDAEVNGCSEFEYIEITGAINGESEALRNKELAEKGSVSTSEPIAKKGIKKEGNLEIAIGEDITEDMKLVEEKHYLELIEEVFNKKIKKEYNSKTLLLVMFDDSIEAGIGQYMVEYHGDDYCKKLDSLFNVLFEKLPNFFSGFALVGSRSYCKYLNKLS